MREKGQLKKWIKKLFNGTMYALKSVFRSIKRLFSFGKTKREELEDLEKSIQTPTRIVVQSFLRRKSAVAALVLLISIFAFVFIAPIFTPMDVNYTDALQQNIAPSYSFRRVPNRLKKQVDNINGFSDFTVGLSLDGEVFVWGDTEKRLQKISFSDIPKQVKIDGAAFVSAGKDHIIAITKKGEIVGWGDKSCGQYGTEEVLNAISMPKILDNGVDVNQVASLSCGYQATALTMKDGSLYVWGNKNTVRNLADFVENGYANTDNITTQKQKAKRAVFTNSALIILNQDGTISTADKEIFTSAVTSKNKTVNNLNAYLVGTSIQKIASNSKCIALLTDENELIVSGAFENDENVLPNLLDGEYFISLNGGTRHFTGVTNFGNVYAWGHNAYGQCNLAQNSRKKTTKTEEIQVFTGALQTYVTEKGVLKQSAGLKGYVMGTDGRGRDVFSRIVHGGKMTMTIGAVAVLVSSLIAIIVGCVSGYFGGWVDNLLMRITEIFASMPFLPFAMLLSQIIKNYNVSENMRIFMIMVILGALSWTGLARLIRGQVFVEREKEFVTASRAMGVREVKIAFRHVLPNVISVILVSMTLNFAGCLLTESSLSYLGFGVQQPQPTWGNMLNGSNNSTVIQNYWWQWLFPALFLSLATICINVIGDTLRDALDPKNQEK